MVAPASSAASALVFAQAGVSETLASKSFIDQTDPQKASYNEAVALFLTSQVLRAIHNDPTGMTSAKLDALATASLAETDRFFPDGARAPAVVPEAALKTRWHGALQVKALGRGCDHWLYPHDTTTKIVREMFCRNSNQLFGRITDRINSELEEDFGKPFGVAREGGAPRPFFLFEFNKEGVPRLYASNNLDSIVKLLDDMSSKQRCMIISVLSGSTFNLFQH